MTSLDILIRVHRHSDPHAFCRSTLHFWIGEARRGRTDFSEIRGLGRTAGEGLATVIARRYEQDQHLSGQKLAQFLWISPETVRHYLSDVMGLK
jgi:hypothetical protein